jgi:hypothetical protein
MLHLNLLSPRQKKEVEWRHVYEMIKRSGLVLFTFLVLASILFWVAGLMLRNTLNETVDRTSSVPQKYRQDQLGVDLDNRLQGISRIQDNFIPWSGFIEDISKYSNQGIIFRSIEIIREQEKINIKGNADTRSALLDFKQNLEESEKFDKIVFPIDNILKKEDVDFNIEVVIDLKNIKTD